MLDEDAPEWGFCGNRTFISEPDENNPSHWFDVWQ